MTRPGDETYRTAPRDCIVADSGWFRLTPAIDVTMEPLVDARTGLYARLSQPDAEEACRVVGGRLPKHAEVLAALDASHLIPPFLMAYDHLMASRRRCEEHDAAVRTMLRDGVKERRDWPKTKPWDRTKPAGNIGKVRTHIPGMNPRTDEAITGWRKRDGSLWQKGGGPILDHRGPGAATRTDYGTTTIAVRDVGISMPPSEPPPGPGAPMRPTIRLGSTGPHVGVLQRILALEVDERFGPRTHEAVRELQRSHDLHDDGIVGPQTWRALGEEPAVATLGASPACRAALRDANATWPNRARASDGIMGDARHQAKPSDHNLGNAVDITHDPVSGCDAAFVALAAMRDPRVAYVIYNRQIWSRKRDAEGWRKYVGDNPHVKHVHISVDAAQREDARPWPWAAT